MHSAIINTVMNCDDVILFTDKLVENITKPENAAYIREVCAKANASMDESKRPASTEPAESFRKLNVDSWFYYDSYYQHGCEYTYL